jgi:NTP pyrophosphatase (non-canonical NTP hydrolase)
MTMPTKGVNILVTIVSIKKMQLNVYQDVATATLLPSADNLAYLVTGLSAESGEVAGKYAKFLRDSNKSPKDYFNLREDLVKELGDVLWFVAIMANNLDYSLESVANINLIKLNSRQQRGTLKGSGDER